MAKKKRFPDPFQERFDLAEKAILIEVHWQYDGGVYAVNLVSKRRILERHPEALINSGILFGYDSKRDYERYHRPYWEQLARMLTGLTAEQLGELGGVLLYDVDVNRVLWEWQPGVLLPQDAATIPSH